jgi:DMSO/TMAO reductase YedYZ molybdopterin-dependent catalytic subunit
MRRIVPTESRLVAGIGLFTLVVGQALAGPTTTFTVTGGVVSPTTYDLAKLSALPATTETVTFQTMNGPQTGTFTGPTVWNLLNTVGLQTPAVKNGILRQYVIAQGSDGYTSLFSLGELAPQFGGGNPQVLTAYQQNGAPLGSTGFARIVAAKDNFGGRYVSNLQNLDVGTARSNPSQGGGTTTQFSLSGAVQTPGAYTLSSLEALPATTETVTYLAGGAPVTASFTGVSIWTLLTDAGIVTNPAVKNDILNYYLYLLATGSDGYEAILSLGELDPMFGGTGMPDLIAYMVDGMPLGPEGFARLVVPGDEFGGRYVSNLVSLQVIDAVVPEPGSLLLLMSGLLTMALWVRRRTIFLAGVIAVAACPSAWADLIVNIPALQDATLFGGSAADNSSSGPGMFVGSDGQSRPKRGLIEFDIPAYVPPNAIITSAALTLYLGQVAGSGGGSADPTPRTIRLYDVTTAWAGTANGTTGFPGPGFGETGQGFPANIDDATWNDAKFDTVPWVTAGGGGDFVSVASGDAVVGRILNAAYSWGSTAQMVSDVQNWLDDASPNYGWLLENDSEALPTTFRAFYTREGAVEQGVPQFAPDLVVTYVMPAPEPPILATIALSALTITALKRRQRSALGSVTVINPDRANRAWPAGEST